MKKTLGRIKRVVMRSSLFLSLRLFRECLIYYDLLSKHNASFNTDRVKSKMQYTLLRENHVIEKGMSMKSPKIGFGQTKAISLLKRLDKYLILYQDIDFLHYPLSTIKEYIKYTKSNGIEIPTIESLFNELISKTAINIDNLSDNAGVKSVSKEYIQTHCSADFCSLLHNRHSIRYFAANTPPKSIINKALDLAQQTPSACNRQAWKTHVYFGENSHKLLKKQGGCNGFDTEIHCSIVVTANMNGFLSYEPFQQYVDGGLYAMNLINSLQALGLGTIPLSCGFYNNKLDDIKMTMNIPDNETLIVIIGVGELLENFNVAVSTRRPVTQTNTYHE